MTDRPSENKLVLGLQVLFGAFFALMGLNGFFSWFEVGGGEEPPEAAITFFTGMGATGYLWPLVQATQVVGGLLIASGRWTALGLLVLTPVLVNIFCFHYFVDPNGLAMAAVLAAIHLFLVWSHRLTFKPLLG
ncbi:MAG TPA: DoxX family membrane protein [Planctomycetes bacterium]|nr:DoxX family membrane protein [Planctomycetota bacterium]HIN80047.1 DoxX family membrane protein [Planctomycetota bacterium]